MNEEPRFEMLEHQIEQNNKRRVKRELAFMQVMSLAMDALSWRVLVLVSLVATVGLFGLASFDPTPGRIVTASLFSVVYLITFWGTRDKEGE